MKRIDKRAPKARVDPVDFSDVRVIGMEEFLLHKDHCYAMVVVHPIRKRVSWVSTLVGVELGCGSIDNDIKAIKQMAYRFRDDQYFLLKIWTAYAGNAR